MPGNVLDITVKPGDRVRFRQQLCSLEAMKMKNAIRSPRDGVIAIVNVTEGQAVSHGDVLFTFADTDQPPAGQ
jgi:biotin carboxyl carrier protein